MGRTQRPLTRVHGEAPQDRLRGSDPRCAVRCHAGKGLTRNTASPNSQYSRAVYDPRVASACSLTRARSSPNLRRHRRARAATGRCGLPQAIADRLVRETEVLFVSPHANSLPLAPTYVIVHGQRTRSACTTPALLRWRSALDRLRQASWWVPRTPSISWQAWSPRVKPIEGAGIGARYDRRDC
jgi:hypothetical protein